MRKNIMRKNLRQSIRRSIGRYIAIVAIIALGAGMFVGLRTTRSDMVATGQVFMDEQNMFDLRLLNTYGWTQENLDAIAQMDGVADAEGVITLDAIGSYEGSDVERVFKLYSIPERVNKVYLLGGRMPSAPDECLMDGFYATDDILGTTITLSANNKADTLDSLATYTFTVVGYVSTPLYMDMSRGNTALGNGSVSAYLYLPADCFSVDYFTEIDVTIPGAYSIYTDEFDSAMDTSAERFKVDLMPYAAERLEEVRKEAEREYEKGYAEYMDGLEQYKAGKDEVFQELKEAEQQLVDAQAEIDTNRETIENGLAQIEEGQTQLDKEKATLASSEKELAQAKEDAYEKLENAGEELYENRKTVTENLELLEDGLAQIEEALVQLNSGVSQLEGGILQLDSAIAMTEGLLAMIEPSVESAQSALDRAKEAGAGPLTIAGLERSLNELTKTRDEYAAQLVELETSRAEYAGQLSELKTQRQTLVDQKAEMGQNKLELLSALVLIDAGLTELEGQKAQAETEFAAAEEQIKSGKSQLNAAQRELDNSKAQLDEGKTALEEGEAELAAGWEEFHEGKVTALTELDDAQAELLDAKAKLDEARQAIDSLSEPEVFVLTRNTNIGYLSLDSNSNIVQGISTVFPAFFLLIAALVCITTMTRMVEEERTQIGTLKALGYGNWAIIGKYLAYAGSAAIIGCGLGVLAGSVVFPLILWEAYSIMLMLTPQLVLLIDWPLCLMVVGVYTGVTLLVTWYCCRMTLREVPAELIRPKPPTSGRKIFLEYLPFWNKIGFLNKVTLRNIFRYRQRLLMMMVGIGGCTALLLTGFGVRDSIVDIVSYQFEEVTLYDMEVRFAEEMSGEDQKIFRDEIGDYVNEMIFYHQSSVELDFDDKTMDITMIVSDETICTFMDFHAGNERLSFPGNGQVLISVGAAEKMGISEGDLITIRTADMDTLELTVSGVYDNNVNNFVIMTPGTVASQLGEAPEIQMACITVGDNVDVHAAGAKISETEGVMSVSISEDLAGQVGSMLDALDLIVITVVICAGLLAVIVLYNLTNINITERIREIATIKVLGFRAGESALYVFKENLILSGMGAFVGLFGGKLLLEFVMSQIKIDMVWFQARLLPVSYVWSVLLTLLSACIVDYILYFKLEKINMAEALKSVE